VQEVVSGYSVGKEENPTYELICTGRTKHAETVKIIYDERQVPYDTLLVAFFNSHDPSTLNSQGPDFGPQYRSIIFYQNEQEKLKAEKYIAALLAKKAFPKITTEVTPLDVFYEAEIYHQDYEKNNPDNPYIQRVSLPRLTKFKSSFKGKLKE
jgi:peptide-methionine (S)-S-oxide reductase